MARALELDRNRCDSAYVVGDVFTGRAVPAGERAREDAVLVDERDGQAVNLEFPEQRDLARDLLAHPLVPCAQSLEGEHVIQRERRLEAGGGFGGGSGGPADRRRW